jgi:serine/threonine protein kinase/tetratricopeptide (TPR) repeat protein
MPLSPSTNLGRYEIRSQISAGGMGEVYLAQDTNLHRAVALKLLPAAFTVSKERLHRFKREAYATSSLNHPNILTIYEIGEDKGHHFIATEFIDGESLRHRAGRSSLELHEVLDIGIQVASALAAAHAARIVHRDIKPENIMIRRDGLVKVLDFGLAKLIEPETMSVDMEASTIANVKTEQGAVMGTISYMSPEQARGAEQVDHRTDIWSLGVVLYELIAGHLPFRGETKTDVIAAILKTEPPILTTYAPDVPAELERIVTKALRKNKEERYQVVKELGLDLKGLKQRLEFEVELKRTGGRAATNGDGTVRDIRQHKLGALLVLATLVSVIAALAYFAYSRRSAESGKGSTGAQASIHSIAVLPFTNPTGDAETEYLSDGIAESLINSLAKLPGVKVIARNSSFKYKGKEVDPQEVARSLDVEAILTGRVMQRGEKLLISVELINTGDKTQIWGEQYNRRATDVLQVQGEISREIAESLRVRLTVGEQQQLAKRETVNPQAYELLLRGRFYAYKPGQDALKKALDYYQQATALDPDYALAYAEVSAYYMIQVLNITILAQREEVISKGEAAARRALKLDENLAEAHYAMGRVKMYVWDWAAAEHELKRAIELNPNLASAHGGYSFYLSIVGRHDEAIAEARRARELDPLALEADFRVGQRLYAARQYDQALEALKKVLEMYREFPGPYIYIGAAYEAKGMYAEAIASYQEGIKIARENTTAQIFLGAAYAKAGERGKSIAILKRMETTKELDSPAELAVLYAALDEREKAFASLERAYAARDFQLQYLNYPEFDSLRSDPRFADLMRRIGLAP